jgi:hypothetical protein
MRRILQGGLCMKTLTCVGGPREGTKTTAAAAAAAPRHRPAAGARSAVEQDTAIGQLHQLRLVHPLETRAVRRAVALASVVREPPAAGEGY